MVRILHPLSPLARLALVELASPFSFLCIDLAIAERNRASVPSTAMNFISFHERMDKTHLHLASKLQDIPCRCFEARLRNR